MRLAETLVISAIELTLIWVFVMNRSITRSSFNSLSAFMALVLSGLITVTAKLGRFFLARQVTATANPMSCPAQKIVSFGLVNLTSSRASAQWLGLVPNSLAAILSRRLVGWSSLGSCTMAPSSLLRTDMACRGLLPSAASVSTWSMLNGVLNTM